MPLGLAGGVFEALFLELEEVELLVVLSAGDVAGAGLLAFFGLKIEPIFENVFAGVAEAMGVALALAFLRVRCSTAGEAEGATDAVGLASAFFRVRCALGEGEAAVLSAGLASVLASFFR